MNSDVIRILSLERSVDGVVARPPTCCIEVQVDDYDDDDYDLDNHDLYGDDDDDGVCNTSSI